MAGLDELPVQRELWERGRRGKRYRGRRHRVEKVGFGGGGVGEAGAPFAALPGTVLNLVRARPPLGPGAISSEPRPACRASAQRESTSPPNPCGAAGLIE